MSERVTYCLIHPIVRRLSNFKDGASFRVRRTAHIRVDNAGTKESSILDELWAITAVMVRWKGGKGEGEGER